MSNIRTREFATESSYVGIDPGIHGQLAVIHPNGDYGITALPYQGNVLDIRSWLGNSFLLPPDAGVVVEQQFSRGRGAQTTFKNYGRLLGGLELAGFDVVEVMPKFWKDYYGLTSDKQLSIDLAKELWDDNFDWTHDQAEALLLAEYGRRNPQLWQPVN